MERNPCRSNARWENPEQQSLSSPLQSSLISPNDASNVAASLRSGEVAEGGLTTFVVRPVRRLELFWESNMWPGWLGEGARGGVASGPKTSQSVENRSPAEGRGARPPVTLGRRERSGRDWMWDLSSFLTWVTLASFCLYS